MNEMEKCRSNLGIYASSRFDSLAKATHPFYSVLLEVLEIRAEMTMVQTNKLNLSIFTIFKV